MRRFLPLVLSALCLNVLVGCAGSGSSSNGGGTTTPPPVTPSNPPPVTPADNPAPTIGGITPQSVVAGTPATTVSVTGTGFITSSSLLLNGTPLKTTYLSGTSIQADVPADTLASGQELSVVASNPTPGGGSSTAVKFLVTAPTPRVLSVSPSAVPQGVDTTITVTGGGFEANSVVLYNGSQRATTFVNGTTLRALLTAKDLTAFGSGDITVYNPGPGASTTTPTQITILASKPTITYVSPSSLTANPTTNVPATISISGSGFASNATVQANGTFLPITALSATYITASLAPSFVASAGTISVVVTNPGSPAVTSNTATITVAAPTYSMTVTPNAAPAGSSDVKITVNASGTANLFYADSVVKWNDTSLSTTFVSSRQITATIPSALLSSFVSANITVVTPETKNDPQPPAQAFTTYLPLPTNDIVYNPMDGLIYASVPGSVSGGLGNTISAIDPASGAITKSINVGSEPTKIALSSDGKQLWVGLNGAAAVRQVDLTTNMAGQQFSLGGGLGIYNPPYTAQDLAVVPGQPNSVVVYTNNGVATVYDSGVARSKTSSGLNVYFNQNSGSLAFGNSSSTLYLNANYTVSLYALTIDSTGITAATVLGTGNSGNSGTGGTLQYDNGRIYQSSGSVTDASTGSPLGQFSISVANQTSPVAAAGPMVSDSALGRAWVVPNAYVPYNGTAQIVAYDESTFNPVGSIPLGGMSSGPSSTAPQDIIRWGENGLAVRTPSQVYVLQNALVKDLSTSPAEVSASIQSNSTATTGTLYSYTLQAVNRGPNAASGVVLTTVLPANVTAASFVATQGSCTGSQVLYCNFGTIPNASSASVTITVTPTTAGTLSLASYLESVSFDSNSANNQASASVTVTGNAYNAAPYVSQLSPALIEAGSTSPILTVNGAGFTAGSSIQWNGQAIPTTFVSSGQLTAVVDSSLVSQLGWASIAVSTPAPGGGQSSGAILHIYKKLDLQANAINFDPYTQRLFATLPSTSTKVTGNSLVAIDPFTGSVGNPINVGSEPNLLAETSDGRYMYIGLSGAKSLGKFNLKTQLVETIIPIISKGLQSSAGAAAAVTMATVPGTNNSLAISTSPNDWNGIGIFDITGSTGAFRSKILSPYDGHAAVFSDSTHFYAYDSATTGAQFYRYSIDSTGVNLIDATTLNGIGGFNGTFQLDNGLVFGGYGGIVNPSATPPSQIAVMSVTSNGGNIGGVVPYQAESKAFFIGGGSGSSLDGSGYFLRRFDTTTFRQDYQVQLPALAYDAWSGVRFGQDGLAILASPAAYNSSQQRGQILLLRGPFILPAEAGSNPAPSLTSVSSTTIAAGSDNQILTVTGTGFLAGATATWNGAARTTTFIDAAHVQVAIPASDVAAALSVTVKVTNPGSVDSNALTLSVQ